MATSGLVKSFLYISVCVGSMWDLNTMSFSQVGEFTNDNRAGISRTLHRISAIRNRKGEIIGLTCRVGRSVRGSANLLRDLVQDGNSLLLIGPPGVGKTTMIRFVCSTHETLLIAPFRTTDFDLCAVAGR